MKNINIPIYRAKKIDSDEYVIGFYSSAYDIHHYVITHLGVDTKTSTVYQMSTDIHKIDPTTLAIHFPDMLDSQGNKIFASLNEDGKGGDIVNLDERCGENFNAVSLYRYYEIHLKGGVDLLNRAKYLRCYPKKDIKVIGIQK